LRYLKGTIHFGLVYEMGDIADEILIGFQIVIWLAIWSTAGMAFYVNNLLSLPELPKAKDWFYHHVKLNT
jgi:hypothetical protein